MVLVFTLCALQTPNKMVVINCELLLGSSFYGSPKLATFYSDKIRATDVAFVLDIDIPFYSLSCRYITKNSSWFPFWSAITASLCPYQYELVAHRVETALFAEFLSYVLFWAS